MRFLHLGSRWETSIGADAYPRVNRIVDTTTMGSRLPPPRADLEARLVHREKEALFLILFKGFGFFPSYLV